MKTVSFRLPDSLMAAIDAEAARRRVSRSDVVRERLEDYGGAVARPDVASLADLAGKLVGAVRGDEQPADLASRKKAYLKDWGYGKKRAGRQRLPRGARAAK